jgi:hypothetical protein
VVPSAESNVEMKQTGYFSVKNENKREKFLRKLNQCFYKYLYNEQQLEKMRQLKKLKDHPSALEEEKDILED